MSAKKRTSLDTVFAVEDLPPVAPVKVRGSGRKPQGSPEQSTEVAQQQERAGDVKRPNIKQHTAYLPLPVHEQLRKLAFEENRKIHDYIVEGLDRVFADRGLPAVKDLS
jgi:hypothetical protein